MPPRIAPHHITETDPYRPKRPWPDNVMVQWGGQGLVMDIHPYSTAFFEAFPDTGSGAGGFIRGEGKTLEAAEDDAFAQFSRENSCNHLWGREHYTNGGQLCRHCRAFRIGAKPVVSLGEWRKPIEWYLEYAMDGHRPYARKLRLRASIFGITARPQ